MNAIEQANYDVIREAVEAAFEDRPGWRAKIGAAVRALTALQAIDSAAPQAAGMVTDAADVMRRAHAFCPSDLPHLDRMRWMADYFVQNCAAPAPQPQEPDNEVVASHSGTLSSYLKRAMPVGTKLYAAPVAAQPQDVLASALRQIAALPRYDLTPKDAIEIAEKALAVQPVQDKPQEESAPLHLVAHNLETDIGRRLRQHATNLNLSQDLRDALTAGANEADRFYKGMVAWKRTAEAKDRPQEASAPAQAAEVERDAARYRWLRSKAYAKACDGWLDFDMAIQMPRIFGNAEIDAAIDADLAASHPQAAQAQKGEQA